MLTATKKNKMIKTNPILHLIITHFFISTTCTTVSENLRVVKALSNLRLTNRILSKNLKVFRQNFIRKK